MDQIKEYILTEGLRPGDALPTEAALCSLLHVSRSSVREAVKTLATLGIVEVRHGWGTYVGTMSLDALVETLVFRGVLSPGDDLRALREVLEVRQALDVAMTDKILASLAGEQHPALHDLVDEMTALAEQGVPFGDQDRAFHTLLLDGVDNSLVRQLVAAFWDVHVAVLPRLDVTLPDALAETARAHAEMLDAAERSDPDAYRAAVAAHYAPIERAIAAAAAGAG
ncbi:FadR/GntR family transcriptional regulator [Beutenbergia cavernae]|uniref:FadR/GntR family transcriptional regulator n=1 Tax=Beutenbergia cavernae TaxID=84757 RepID=UPI00019AD20C|nr:FadR/GntR family transcriptional regulator [Beutenbergia cavernae]